MDNFFKRLSLTGIAVVLSTTAYAADLPAPVIEHTPIVPAVGGLYLRGDIGYKIYSDPSGSFDDYGNAGMLRFERESMDNAWMIGVGVGYQFNDYFRSDITLDYETPAGAKGYAVCGGCTGGYSEEGTDIDVWTVMVNAYVDLGTWNRITPYVGAGVGAAYVQTDNTYSINPGTGTTDYAGTHGDWNFAWALMAGAEYSVTENWSLDAGYRYKDLGKAQTVKLADTASPNSRVEWDDLTAHEFRLGARYTFNTMAAPAYPQGPIMSNF
ncbi:outer membrane protein [Roseibium salinum]|uniref:Porin family protein n=1 Tax=Roseibium salinum TaxID=1604349 RepID=A0ABT3R7X0_9HYPH|nr:outer membrane protein [Roseibium sp. DSM 29163]MCX2725406.1 porin family protein [Roseibium sp. DSM 29163]MDN3720771.1 porin family protein [Roseibium salinum]